MAEILGGTLLARALKSMGVDTIFFLIGGPCLEVIAECSRLGMRMIDVRDERAAAMEAVAYTRISGKPGVVVTGSGCDTTNTATGVAVALADRAPLISIGGSQAGSTKETGFFQDLNQVGMMSAITKKAWQVQSVDRICDYVEMTFRHAFSGSPGPVYLDLPVDVLYGRMDDSKIRLPTPVNLGRAPGDANQVKEAIKLLSKAERPVVIAGSGAIWSEAGAELQEFVDSTGIPFYTTPLARGLIPEDHPLCFLAARSFAWLNADAILLVGTRANWIIQRLKSPRFADKVKLIAVNIDPDEIGRNRPIDVGIVGDAKAVLSQLTRQAKGKFSSNAAARAAWAKKLAEVHAQKESEASALLNCDEKPIHPMRLCKEVRDFLSRDAILVVDGHVIMNSARQSIPSYYPRHRLNPGVSGCIGIGVPFGVGAKVAMPDKPVLVLTGDGAFGFDGIEMDTAVRHKLNIVVVVSNNGCWAGNPGTTSVGYALGYTRYDKMVEALGGAGYYVEEPQAIRPALESAFASGKPALVNVITSLAKVKTQVFGWRATYTEVAEI